MRITFTFLILFCISSSFAQQNKGETPSKKTEPGDPVFVKVEIEANTDRVQFQKYLLKNAKLPDSLIWATAGTDRTVVVSFIVDQYGRVTDIKSENDPGPGLGKLAVRLIRNYPGTWSPSVQCGRAVKSYRKEKIAFEPYGQ